MTQLQNVVLVHGGFVDGSGWRGVYDLLRADGFNVSVVQNPTVSLERRRRALPGASSISRTARRSSSATPTAAPSSPRPARTKTSPGSSTSPPSLPTRASRSARCIADSPTGAPVPPILPPQNGFLFLDRDQFAPRSPRMSRSIRPCSWPTRRCPGASTPSAARSPTPRGGASRAGTSSRPTTT